MSDQHSKQHHHHHHRHRHRSRDHSVFGEVATGVGTSFAAAFQVAGRVVNHSLMKTDDIVQGIMPGSRSSNGSHSQIYQQHYPQQQFYSQQQHYSQQHYATQQPYPQQQQQQLYPKQQYYYPQHVYQHKESSSSTVLHHGNHNLLTTKSPQTSNSNGLTPAYGEPPPAYDEISPGYSRPHHPPPPAYSESLSAHSAFPVDNAVDVLNFDGLPPAYVKSPSVLTGAPSATTSSSAIVASAPVAESTAFSDKSLPGYMELPQVYLGANAGSSQSYGKAVPAYGYPPCYHYKYTDGCKYCLKWKWDS